MSQLPNVPGASKPQEWHRPYAEALMCWNSAELYSAITRAQRAVLNRYLEMLAASKSEPEEAADLTNAVDVLQALKRTTDARPFN
jgi:hypothetical protein